MIKKNFRPEYCNSMIYIIDDNNILCSNYFFANRYEKMWGDECYYSIEGECEFFQDWLKQTKDEVSIILYWYIH